jgi:hypothetical protein
MDPVFPSRFMVVRADRGIESRTFPRSILARRMAIFTLAAETS